VRSAAQLIYNVTGQTLPLRVPQGRPTSATFEVFRNYASDDGAAEFTGTASVDSVNTTVNAASGASQADPQKVSLASTTGIVLGRKYLLSESSLREWVEPIEIRATYIRVRHPLLNDYTTSATFVSTWLSAAVTNAFIQDLGKLSDLSDLAPDYRVRWTILVGGTTIVAHSYFDVLRAEQRHSVDIDDVNERAPGLRDSLPKEYQAEEGRPLVDAAYRAVRAHFFAINFDVNALRDNEALDELIILRALRILAEGGWHPKAIDAGSYILQTTTNYDRFFETHFSVVLKHQTQFQLGNALATQAVDSVPAKFWRK